MTREIAQNAYKKFIELWNNILQSKSQENSNGQEQQQKNQLDLDFGDDQ